MYPVGVETIQNQKIPVFLDHQDNFTAKLDGLEFTACFRWRLIDKLKEHLRRTETQVSIPAFQLMNGGPVSVTITGFHADNEDILYRDADGKARHCFPATTLYRALDEEQLARYMAAIESIKEAQKTITSLCSRITHHCCPN